MSNLLLEEIEYKTQTTRRGIWRRYLYPTGARFQEFRSHKTVWGVPLVHYSTGICPETGKRITAKGIIAIGRVSVGIFALGQASFGAIALGQLAVGLVGLGQAAAGLAALGQLSLGVMFGLGQFSTGLVSIGQFAFGRFVLAQLGFGEHVWSTKHADPEAVEFFWDLFYRLTSWAA